MYTTESACGGWGRRSLKAIQSACLFPCGRSTSGSQRSVCPQGCPVPISRLSFDRLGYTCDRARRQNYTDEDSLRRWSPLACPSGCFLVSCLEPCLRFPAASDSVPAATFLIMAVSVLVVQIRGVLSPVPSSLSFILQVKESHRLQMATSSGSFRNGVSQLGQAH